MMLTGEALRARALELMSAAGINKTRAAALVPALSQSSVYKFFDGSLETPAIEERIRELVALLERTDGEAARPPVVSIEAGRMAPRRLGKLRQRPIYDISSTRKIGQSIDYAIEHQAIVLITADYGVGKTRGIEIWRQENAETPSVVLEFDIWTDTGRLAFISRLAGLLGIQDGIQTAPQAARVYSRIIDRLREEPMVLIFDQAETVKVEILHLIRQIWDRTRDYGVAVVLLAGPPLYERLKFRKVRALGALTSRISAWPVISGPGRDEVAGILAAEGYRVEGAGQAASDERAALTEAAFDLVHRGCGGSVRLLLELIDLLGRAKGKRLGKTAVGNALAMLSGTRLDASSTTGWTSKERAERAEGVDAEEAS